MNTSSIYLTPELARLLADKARSFSYAARFLPAEQREATRVLYAFCRTMDDLVDEPPPGVSPADARRRIAEWRDWLTAGASAAGRGPDPACLSTAIGAIVESAGVPTGYLLALLTGVESDLGRVRVSDFAALHHYCMLVAGVVGLAMSHLLGVTSEQGRVAAANLGIAMQLTNVLRDVGGDLGRDRIYLPADEMARFGYSEDRLRALAAAGGCADEDFRALMRFQIARTRVYYERGLAGVWLLPPGSRPAILAAGRIYRAILDRIEANDYDVLRRRAITSRLLKIREGLVAHTIVRLWGQHPPVDDAPLDLEPYRNVEVAQWRESL